MDEKLMNDSAWVGFHPMQNDATTSISNADMKKVVALSQHEPEVVDFSKLVSAGEAGAAPAKQEAKKPAAQAKKEEVKQDVHQLGIEYTKEQNFSKWY